MNCYSLIVECLWEGVASFKSCNNDEVLRQDIMRITGASENIHTLASCTQGAISHVAVVDGVDLGMKSLREKPWLFAAAVYVVGVGSEYIVWASIKWVALNEWCLTLSIIGVTFIKSFEVLEITKWPQ